MLWTAARLVSGILFAALCWYTTELAAAELAEQLNPGRASIINGAIGFFVGWTVLGSRVGDGIVSAISYGATTTVMAVGWCLLADSVLDMIRLAYRQRFAGPGEAIVDVFRLFVDYGQVLLTPNILMTLVVGGIASGLIAEWTARNFR